MAQVMKAKREENIPVLSGRLVNFQMCNKNVQLIDEITYLEVIRCIRILKSGKAAGKDNVIFEVVETSSQPYLKTKRLLITRKHSQYSQLCFTLGETV